MRMKWSVWLRGKCAYISAPQGSSLFGDSMGGPKTGVEKEHETHDHEAAGKAIASEVRLFHRVFRVQVREHNVGIAGTDPKSQDSQARPEGQKTVSFVTVRQTPNGKGDKHHH